MLKRVIKWLLIVVAVGTALYAAVYGYHYQQYRAELAVYRSLGYPTNMEELRAWNPVDDPALNAAIPLHRAFALLNYDYSLELKLPYSGYSELDVKPRGPYPDDVIRDIGIVLDLNRETLDIIQSSIHLEQYRPEISDAIISDEDVQLSSSVQTTSYLLSEQSVYRAHSGQMDGAIDCIEAILWLGSTFRQNPGIVSLFLADAIEFIEVGAVSEFANRYELTDSHQERMIEMLQETNGNRKFHRAIIGDAIRSNHFLQTLLTSGDVQGFTDRLELSLEYLLPDYPTSRAGGLRVKRRHVAILEHAAWFEIPDELLLFDDSNFVELIMMPALIAWARSEFEHRAKIESVITGLHVERYRSKYGVLPESLDDLVPEFIDAVPHGLFVDEPIGYVVDDAGYVVYAVGNSEVKRVKEDSHSEDCDCIVPGRFGFRRYLD